MSAFANISLPNLFDAAEKLFLQCESGTTQTNILKCIEMYQQASALIRTNSVFSSNESLEELSTRRLSYLLIPFRQGTLCDKVQVDMSEGPTARLNLLKRSDLYLELFLRQTINHRVCDNYDMERWESYTETKKNSTNTSSNGQEDDLDRKPKTSSIAGMSRETAEQMRAIKIQNYQRSKVTNRRLQEILHIRNKRKARQSKLSGGSTNKSTGFGLNAEEIENIVEDDDDFNQEDDVLLNGDDDELEREHVSNYKANGAL